MICRLCLIYSEQLVNVFSDEGINMEIASLITKHLYIELTNDDPVSSVICQECCEEIKHFHNFYSKIVQAQSKICKLEYEVNGTKAEQELTTVPHALKVEINESVQNNGNLEPVDVENIEVVPLNSPASSVDSFQDEDEEPLQNLIDSKKVSSQTKIEPQRRSMRQSQKFQNNIHCKSESNKSNRKKAMERKLRKSRAGVHQIKNEIKEEPKLQEGITHMQISTVKESDYLKNSKKDDEKIAKYMKLQCELCHLEFNTFAEIRRHYRVIHNRKGYIICCNKKLYKRVLILDHINKHLNPEYFKCEECNKTFSDKQCLKNHMTRHESEDVKAYKCEVCPRRYAKQYLLDQHKLIHMPQEQRQYFCDKCNKAFPTKNLLRTHCRYVHENVYGKMCHICAKVIRGKALFEKHQLEHAGIMQPKVQCEQCGAWLKHQYSLKKHMRRHQEELSDHICPICSKSAPSKGALRSHIKYVHASERTFQCSVCNKAFKKALILKEHMTTHTGEVLYTCPHCPKTFNSSANMHSHRKKVHRQEWEESRRNRGMPKPELNVSSDTPNESVYIIYEQRPKEEQQSFEENLGIENITVAISQ